MPLAALLQLVQILSAAGSAAVDLTKVVEAVKSRGSSTLTDDEAVYVRSVAAAHAAVLSTYDDSTNNG